MARTIALRRLVEDPDPGIIRRLAAFCRRSARNRDRSRPRQAPKIIQARSQDAETVAAEDIDAAPRRGRHLPAKADMLEPANRGFGQPSGSGDNERQALQRSFEAEMGKTVVASE